MLLLLPSCGSSLRSLGWVSQSLLLRIFALAHGQSTIGLGYHDRWHCPPERARKEAPRVIYSICPTGDRHHVRAHSSAFQVPPAD